MNLDIHMVKRLVKERKIFSLENLKQVLEEEMELTYSTTTLNRFVCKHKISLYSRYISDEELSSNISSLIDSLGISYGRKTMKGALLALGINASQRRISKCLRNLNPGSHKMRVLNIHRALNPKRYIAPHFGHNLHMDQNEKLVEYGIVIVLAVDGQSNFIASGYIPLQRIIHF